MNASYRVFCHVMEQRMLDSSKTGAFLDFLWAPFHQLAEYSFLINFGYTFINQLFLFTSFVLPHPPHTKDSFWGNTFSYNVYLGMLSMPSEVDSVRILVKAQCTWLREGNPLPSQPASLYLILFPPLSKADIDRLLTRGPCSRSNIDMYACTGVEEGRQIVWTHFWSRGVTAKGILSVRTRIISCQGISIIPVCFVPVSKGSSVSFTWSK